MTAAKLITLIRTDGDTGAVRDALRARIADGAAGLDRLVFNTVLPVEVRATGGTEAWDAVVEAWFASADAREAWIAVPLPVKLHVDLRVEQRLIHDSGARPLPAKVMVTFRRRPDLGREAAQAWWQGRHVEVGLVEHNATDFLKLYFQNHVTPDNKTARPEHDFDGLPEFWLDQDALASVGPDSEVMKAIAEDEKNFISPGGTTTMLLDEEELFARDPALSGWDARADA